jgi:hypothetical protein
MSETKQFDMAAILHRRISAARRTTRALNVVVGALFGLSAVFAAEKVVSPPADPLAPMAFLAGYCWSARFPDGKATDTHCFEWVFARHQLRDRHTVSGGPEAYGGETLYFWDSANRRITYRYIDATGGHSNGHVEARDGALHFPADAYVAANGQRMDFVTQWQPVDATHFHMLAQQRVGEKLNLALDLMFARTDKPTQPVGAK